MRRDPRVDPRRGDVVATLERRLTVLAVDDGVVAFDIREDDRTSKSYRVRLNGWRLLTKAPWTFVVPAPPASGDRRRWECLHCGTLNQGVDPCRFCCAASPPRVVRTHSGRG